MKHKWHKEIKAWADGAEIEMWYGDRWEQVHHIPEWNMEAEFRIKPQLTISYKETIIERLRNDDEFWNEVFGAYDKQCDKQETQPKEPKYLYVYLDDNYELSTIPIDNDNWKYIGKIKLEDDDD